MRPVTILGAALAASLATAGWLAWDRAAVRAELERVRGQATAAAPEVGATTDDDDGGGDGDRDRGRGGRRAGALGALSALGRAMAKVESGAPGPDASPDPNTRRERRQARITEMFGRRPGETEAQYRSRVAPVVSGLLAGPRDRAEEGYKEALAAAEVTPEQQAALDKAVVDARAEVVAAANLAIAAGDLTPYRRNSRGVLTFIGGTVGVLDGLDARMRESLSADQLATLGDTGFDLVEYLGLTVPWESLNPPPPADR